MWWPPVLPPFKATDVASFTESVEICPTGIYRDPISSSVKEAHIPTHLFAKITFS